MTFDLEIIIGDLLGLDGSRKQKVLDSISFRNKHNHSSCSLSDFDWSGGTILGTPVFPIGFRGTMV